MSMDRRIAAFLMAGACVVCALQGARGQADQADGDAPHVDVRIVGPVSTKDLLEGLGRYLKDKDGLVLNGKVGLTNADALYALAAGKADLAILSKPLTGDDRADYPDALLQDLPIGMEVVAIGVSTDVWDAGVHSITPDTMRAIYEQKITNWKALGGPDEAITFYDYEQGAGIWEVFADWLYGDDRKAPFPKVQTVATSQDARDDLEFTAGAMVPMAAGFVDGVRCHALGVTLSGSLAQPIAADVASGKYPIQRPLSAVTVGRPTNAIRVVTEFLTSADGQALLKKTGALGLEAVPKPASTDY